MPRTIAYIRVSTERQEVNNQRLEILDYARRNDFKVEDFMRIPGSGLNYCFFPHYISPSRPYLAIPSHTNRHSLRCHCKCS